MPSAVQVDAAQAGKHEVIMRQASQLWIPPLSQVGAESKSRPPEEIPLNDVSQRQPLVQFMTWPHLTGNTTSPHLAKRGSKARLSEETSKQASAATKVKVDTQDMVEEEKVPTGQVHQSPPK